MEKTYNPGQIEASWYQSWEESGFFAPSGEVLERLSFKILLFRLLLIG